MFFQIGLFTGVFLSAILGVSFGSLATLFTKDPEVLGIVKTGVLVRNHTYVWQFVQNTFLPLKVYVTTSDLLVFLMILSKICHSLSVLVNL